MTNQRITLADIESNIASEHYFTAADGIQHACMTAMVPNFMPQSMTQVTFCVLMLKNGTKIVGVNYGAIDPEQHNKQRGLDEARKNAIEQVWPLMGYHLRQTTAGKAPAACL